MTQTASSREVLLPGIAFSGYRSFAAEPQRMLFETPVTVVAGINNSGKSNVLRYVQHILPTFRSRNTGRFPSSVPQLDSLDKPTGYRGALSHIVSIPVRFEPLSDRELGAAVRNGRGDRLVLQRALMTLAAGESGVFWPQYSVNGDEFTTRRAQVEQLSNLINNYRQTQGSSYHAQAFESAAVSANGGGTNSLDFAVRSLVHSLNPFGDLPPVVTVRASRRVEDSDVLVEDLAPGAEGDDKNERRWLSGQGLIKQLAGLQNPHHDDWDASRAKWAEINRFVQHVLDDSEARINVPHGDQLIQIETPRRVLPLENLGSGIEQVVVLAAAATIVDDTLVCMEEPESNLHPHLQRKLVRYLSESTTNQYLIATHSAHFLDYERASVYHLSLSDTGTKVTSARHAHELVHLCNDLGYRPSDLMQTNCVIWVEGPSDRVYIRRWLELSEPTLRENVDYKIMFYGGSLLTHLTVDDSTLDDFINLRRLNRASVVVMDSDRTGPGKRLKPAVRRLREEFTTTDGSGHPWITAGYTIENYLPNTVLAAAARNVHPRWAPLPAAAKWTNPLVREGAKKLEIARAAAQLLRPNDLNVMDLRKQTNMLAAFIHQANDAAATTDTRQDR